MGERLSLTVAAVLLALSAAIAAEPYPVLQSPKLQEQFARERASPVEMSSAEFGKYMESEIAKWGPAVEQGGSWFT
jgi:tripartite-type tricarboxylate transporter receptor subunit TctC